MQQTGEQDEQDKKRDTHRGPITDNRIGDGLAEQKSAADQQ